MNDSKAVKSISVTALLLVSSAFLGGCGKDEAEQATVETDNSPRMIQREAPRRTATPEPAATLAEDKATDFRVVPRLEGQLEEDGLGLEAIIDASSKHAYAESMAWIAEDVSTDQYKRLERSLRYIQTYDTSVLGNEQRFLQFIDGKTGQELIDRASRLIAERGQR